MRPLVSILKRRKRNQFHSAEGVGGRTSADTRRCDGYISHGKCDDCDLAYPNVYDKCSIYCKVAGKNVTNVALGRDVDRLFKTERNRHISILRQGMPLRGEEER